METATYLERPGTAAVVVAAIPGEAGKVHVDNCVVIATVQSLGGTVCLAVPTSQYSHLQSGRVTNKEEWGRRHCQVVML